MPAALSPAFGTQSFKLLASFANFGDMPRTATVILSTGSGTDSTQKTIATAPVQPHSIATANLPELPVESVPLNSITVHTDAGAGELLSNIQAVSDTGILTTIQSLQWKDQSQMENSGQHPWNTSDLIISTLILFNPDASLANDSVRLTIRAGQSTWTKVLTLAPQATTALSINDIIYKQEVDENGHKLPRDSSHGIVTWSSLKNPRIFGKLVQFDAFTSISRSYACPAIITICNTWLNDISLRVGGTATSNVNTQACYSTYGCNACDGWCGDEGGAGLQSYWWIVANSNIAGLTSSQSDPWATLQGVSAGQTTLSVSVKDSNYCEGGASAQANITCAVPVNFRQTSAQDTGGGTLQFNYSYDSSTGNLSDLAGCTIGEIVTYPGGNPYAWPHPPFPYDASTPNPTIIDLDASTPGGLVDNHRLVSTNFDNPTVSGGSFTATQYYRYKCPCSNNGDYVNLAGPISIVRSVNSTDGIFYYTVSKSGATAGYGPLP